MNYWLFKTEPDEFSIDDLASHGKKGARWDGIRNYQARNFLRDQVRVGDKVLIYHSSCKQIGVVGTARVIKTAYADPTQFDPDSHYYDAKSPAQAPRWCSVDLRFDSKFATLVSLNAIKQNPALSEMMLVRQGRLSIQPVTEGEWRAVIAMAEK